MSNVWTVRVACSPMLAGQLTIQGYGTFAVPMTSKALLPPKFDQIKQNGSLTLFNEFYAETDLSQLKEV